MHQPVLNFDKIGQCIAELTILWPVFRAGEGRGWTHSHLFSEELCQIWGTNIGMCWISDMLLHFEITATETKFCSLSPPVKNYRTGGRNVSVKRKSFLFSIHVVDFRCAVTFRTQRFKCDWGRERGQIIQHFLTLCKITVVVGEMSQSVLRVQLRSKLPSPNLWHTFDGVLPSRRSRLPLYERHSTTLSRQWATAGRRHRVAYPSAICIVTVAACSTVVAQDHRRSRLPRCRGKGLERAAAGDHVAAIVRGIQACTENRTVPQIIRQRKLSATAALTL